MNDKKLEASKSAGLQDLRDQIDGIDEKVLQILAERRRLVTAVADRKAEDGGALRDPKREQEILVEQIKRGRGIGLDSHFVTRIFHEIIDDRCRHRSRARECV